MSPTKKKKKTRKYMKYYNLFLLPKGKRKKKLINKR